MSAKFKWDEDRLKWDTTQLRDAPRYNRYEERRYPRERNYYTRTTTYVDERPIYRERTVRRGRSSQEIARSIPTKTKLIIALMVTVFVIIMYFGLK